MDTLIHDSVLSMSKEWEPVQIWRHAKTCNLQRYSSGTVAMCALWGEHGQGHVGTWEALVDCGRTRSCMASMPSLKVHTRMQDLVEKGASLGRETMQGLGQRGLVWE
jgi:hypothetical protein